MGVQCPMLVPKLVLQNISIVTDGDVQEFTQVDDAMKIIIIPNITRVRGIQII